MKRRELMALLAGAAAALPLAAPAQQRAMPGIGFLSSRSPEESEALVAAFRGGLGQLGFAEGQNLEIAFRWVENRYNRLPALAAELVRHRVAVIVAAGGPISALAAKAATATIPIVFTAVPDPVKGGLVASFSRPGGNVTGIAALTVELDAKRLELLHELVPTADAIGVLLNPTRPDADSQLSDVQAAARAVGRQLVVLSARTEGDIDAAFATLARQPVGGLVVAADPFLTSRREQLVALAARDGVPAIYQWREFADAGGLMSYGPSFAEAYRQAGIYTGKILQGAKPADLPVMQPTTFELVINMRAAKALGLTIPQSILTRAEELIE